MKKTSFVLATALLLASPALAGRLFECDPEQGSKCYASWRLPDGSWERLQYNKGDEILVGDDDSVHLEPGWKEQG